MGFMPIGSEFRRMTPDEAKEYMKELEEAEKNRSCYSQKREPNRRFGGEYYVVNLETQELVESHQHEENAKHAALILNQHEIEQGRLPVYQVFTV